MKKPSDYRILVVDDEPDLREAIAFDLKRKGYNVLLAASGHEAYDLVIKDPVDLILSDVRMPDGDGLELLDRIKARDVFLPVVMFITGFADITLEEAYERGADAVFGKPFDRKALTAAVERALLPPDIRYARNGSRVEVDLSVEMKFLESGCSAKCRARNIARGGMFVAFADRFPKLEKCEFAIECDVPLKGKIAGEGLVRWKREKAAGDLYPTGLGIEFLNFDENCKREMLEMINFMKTKSFIPRN